MTFYESIKLYTREQGGTMKNAFRIVLAVLFCSVIALTTQGCAKKPAPAKEPEQIKKTGQEDAKTVVVATVNGVPITMETLLKMMNSLSVKKSPDEALLTNEEIKNRALDRLILIELAYQKATALGLNPDPRNIDNAITNLKVNAGGEKEYAAFLAQQNATEADLRAQVKRSLALELIFAQEVSNKITVPEDEIKKEYEKEKQRYIQPEKASVIDVAFLLKENNKASLKKANDILKKIRADKGKDPWKLVLDGTFIVRNIDIHKDKQKELYAAAIKLKAGGLSGVIKTSDGLHIIKLKTYSPERQLSFDEVKGSLEGKFRIQARQKRQEEWGRELRKDAKIEIAVTSIEITDGPKDEIKEKKSDDPTSRP